MLEARDNDRVSLRLGSFQLTGRLDRLMRLVQYDPDAEYLESFLIELPRSKFLFAPHRIRCVYMTTLCGDLLAYHIYKPGITPEDNVLGDLVKYLTDSHVAQPILQHDSWLYKGI